MPLPHSGAGVSVVVSVSEVLVSAVLVADDEVMPVVVVPVVDSAVVDEVSSLELEVLVVSVVEVSLSVAEQSSRSSRWPATRCEPHAGARRRQRQSRAVIIIFKRLL
jgi:hypothetical protein